MNGRPQVLVWDFTCRHVEGHHGLRAFRVASAAAAKDSSRAGLLGLGPRGWCRLDPLGRLNGPS